jgi:hypothetical protein
MITADQIAAHLVGDYILQSNWMATEKTKNSTAAAVHAVSYTIPFSLITSNIYALMIISITHFMIDRFRLARYVVWIKNGPWHPLTVTGYPDEVPAWLSVWLLIIADNTIHIIINGAAIAYFA